jgi:hypothetical protein
MPHEPCFFQPSSLQDHLADPWNQNGERKRHCCAAVAVTALCFGMVDCLFLSMLGPLCLLQASPTPPSLCPARELPGTVEVWLGVLQPVAGFLISSLPSSTPPALLLSAL